MVTLDCILKMRLCICAKCNVIISTHTHLHSFFSPPLEFQFIGENARSDGGAVVASPSDQHAADARNLAFRAECQRFRRRHDAVSSVGVRPHSR